MEKKEQGSAGEVQNRNGQAPIKDQRVRTVDIRDAATYYKDTKMIGWGTVKRERDMPINI